MSSRSGTLTWKTITDGSRRLVIIEDGAGERRFERRFLDPALADRSDEDLAGRSVEFDWVKGRAKHVRDKGTVPTAVSPPPDSATAVPQPAPAPAAPAAPATPTAPGRGTTRQPPRHMAPSGRSSGSAQPSQPSQPSRPSRQAAVAGIPRETSHRAPEPLNAFINPYGFVPAPQRDESHGALGDVGDPTDRDRLAGHDRLRDGRWSGTIGVTLTVATPLLLLDTARAERDPETGHPTYSVLERSMTTPEGGEERRPHLPATAVKGMLRSAYEVVTNSRFGVFTGHDTRLGYRMAARDGLASIPARVVGEGDTAEIELLPGTTPAGHQGRHGSPMHAAWLPSYWTAGGSKNVRDPGRKSFNITMPDGSPPRHGTQVRARIQLVQHHRWDRRSATHTPDFQLWWVRSLAWPGGEPAPAPLLTSKQSGASWYEPIGPEKVVDGWACVTNRNIDRKHDERVFFHDPDADLREYFPLDRRLRSIWRDIITGYTAAHRPGEIPTRDQDDNGRDDITKGGWSRHLLRPKDTLTEGDLIYVRLDARGGIDSLYPVTIARELFSVPPAALLPRSLRPADTVGELSPADRVFGWVRTEDPRDDRRDDRQTVGGDDRAGAWLGSLRIGPVICDQASATAVERFEGRGLPLAILGQPKPGQGRFYVGAERNGHPVPLPAGLSKGDWFVSAGRMLRGRKVYPHHAGLPDGYWKNPTADRTQVLDGGRYQEYRRPRKSAVPDDNPRANPLNREGTAFATQTSGGVKDENRDDQNRSVKGWVRPGTTFRFTVDVRNLSDVELGALLWLLDLGGENGKENGDGGADGSPGRFHRLGLGKPLGFGSVRLTLDPTRTDLRTGESWAGYYRSLGPDQPPAEGFPAAARETADAFRNAVAGGPSFEEIPHIRAFLAAASGDPSTPVHYPRVRPGGLRVDVPVPPDPRGRSFEWFVQNEQQQGGRVRGDRGLSLPDPGAGPLPVHPAKDR